MSSYQHRSINYTVPGIARSKKNSSRIVNIKGRSIIIPSEAYKKYEAMAGQYLRPKPEKPIDYPVEVTCIYLLPCNKDGSKPKRKIDLVNLLGATHDILTHHGILADDNANIIVSVDGSRVYFVRHDPKTIITITELENTDAEIPCRDRAEGNGETES